jgi:PPOX class probable F420-dependent enzyme
MPADRLKSLRKEKYISVTTSGHDNRTVAAPAWFAIDGDRLVVFAGSTTETIGRVRGKLPVTVAPCTPRGKVIGTAIPGTAMILPASAGTQADRLLRARYPIAWRLMGGTSRLARLVRRQPAGQRVYLEVRRR